MSSQVEGKGEDAEKHNQKTKIKDMSDEELKDYNRLKQQERRRTNSDEKKQGIMEKDRLYQASKLKEQKQRMQDIRNLRSDDKVEFDNISQKHTRRKNRRQNNEDDKISVEKDEECKEWYSYFKKNDETKEIMKKYIPFWHSKCKVLELEDKKKERNKQVEDDKKRKDEILKDILRQDMAEKGEICVCDEDTDCKYCEDIHESEKNLCEHNTWTKEEELEFERQEMDEYRKKKKEDRNEKRRKKAEKARLPMPALPETEMCLYEKIREDNIAERKREWAKLELEWDKIEKEKEEKSKKVIGENAK